MKLLRLYAEADGVSRFRSEDVAEHELTRRPGAFEIATVAASGAIVRRSTPAVNDSAVHFHAASRRQLVVPLVGGLEITLENGETARVMPGEVLLAEDVGARGHSTQMLFDRGEAVTMLVHLGEGALPRT